MILLYLFFKLGHIQFKTGQDMILTTPLSKEIDTALRDDMIRGRQCIPAMMKPMILDPEFRRTIGARRMMKRTMPGSGQD